MTTHADFFYAEKNHFRCMSYRLKELLQSPPDTPFLAVLGDPIEHSLSPLIHGNALKKYNSDWQYLAIRVPKEDVHLISDLLAVSSFKGANVTIPLKETVPGLVNFCSDEVRQIGAANTIYPTGEDWAAANTDVHGFLTPLWAYQKSLTGQDAIVLGTGGAARAVCYALVQKLGVNRIFLVSRNPEVVDVTTYPSSENITVIDYNSLPEALSEGNLIVNTTPVGMHPNIDQSPISGAYEHLLAGKICYDLIYRPQQTLFLKQARQAGGEPVGGLPMFVHQAAKSFEIWTGNEFPVAEAEKLIRETIYE